MILDDVLIFRHNILNPFQVTRFDALLFFQHKHIVHKVKFGIAAVTLHMYVDWFMFLTVEKERKTEETKNLWHELVFND